MHQSLNQFGLHVPPPKEVVVLRPIPPDNDAMPHEPVIRSLCLSRLRAAAVVALWWLLMLCRPACAAGIAATRDGLLQFHHTAWSIERGAPADIWDIQQADGGALWLATGFGLFKFDGEHFTRQAAPEGEAYASHNMTALSLTTDDGAWIGYFNAGIDRLADGHLTHFVPGKDVPDGMVFRIERDGSGRLWAAIDGGLCWFDGRRWHRAGADWGYPESSAQWLLRDRRGILWVSDGSRILSLQPGARRFESSGQQVGHFTTMAEHPDGTVWVADPHRGVFALTDTHGTVLPALVRSRLRFPGLFAHRIRFMRDGALWGSDYVAGGVFRVAQPTSPTPVLERYGPLQGLTSSTAGPLLEDHEGNLWAGTNLGLNRFRHRALLPLAALLPGHPTAVAIFATVATPGAPVLLAVLRDERQLALTRTGIQALQRGAPASALQVPASANGWLLGDNRLLRLHAGRTHALPLPQDVRTGSIRAFAVDAQDTPWACPDASGPQRWDGHRWQAIASLLDQPCSVLLAAPDGALWVGSVTGELSVLRGGQVRHYTANNGLSVGPITAIWHSAALTLVAGESGLAVLRSDGRFQQVADQANPVLQGITGIVRDRHDTFWLNGNRGVVQIGRQALLRSLRTGVVSPTLRLYDIMDGLPGVAQQASPVPTAIAAADGLLWFTTNQGLAWLDPEQTYRNPTAPKVFITDVVANDRPYPRQDGLHLPEWTDRLRIGYDAISLTRPERVRFRYRLEGVDARWQDAGNRNEAFYTNLAPGRYRFRIAAANNDGLENARGDTLDFVIEPAFIQTWQFKACCALALLLALGIAWRMRTRQVAARLRARLEERYRERERIARELHDTLLQGTQGLILRLHAASRSLPWNDPRRLELEQAVDLAENALAEGRDRVSGLRDSQSLHEDLAAALQRARNATMPPPTAALQVAVEGRPMRLRHLVADELFQLGREALANADRHANATGIALELRYGSRDFTLRIRDDGRGLDPDVLHGHARTGHWGLTGMQERAQRIGAKMQLWSRPGSGTEIQITLPARAAYLRAKRWWWPFHTARSTETSNG
ncbi:Histidine kinase/Y_Y_Y domain/Histidine kinase-, DNA gyrase B-, and HSP90-like ATPase [Xanthomonas citri pv. citri]|nr:Histidine kinase/Y_Y_Y domain/Histidine kinase-, DNA gyrase B-, and HSP90-like ATPase [Xanthomonas citri pv. citri]AJY86701.1 Histidine kinase/Y_Y_Y domain/Histidine kinase-, DNA gyrase B-, and HSP90-like ATPase [Xanthomonas citri subsp. citri UI6]AJY95594.1 Histidine kinase/Y_Y_Y domain/Histidine kinase-, DNA gyrase B-, and HSP90-like ATPase [Xanthomonas citri pv. citri]AJZ00017.1 Histidine kinase/Y_Y_Y domain/Histidine kinase-, DNA gyrase B-, and HSP90-like ATPase [Xanthomonas citri pv. cit